MSFDNYLKRIDHRDWNKIRSKWLNYIPDNEFPGQVPEHEILDFFGLEAFYQKANNPQKEYKEEVPFLRREILREAIYFIHKSTHVCGAANIHIENGALSWSISSAYQSTFFALKGILGLLGLSFPRINAALMIDCFPEEERLSKNQIKRRELPKPELKFVVFPKLSHTHMWQIFQRVLNVSEIDIWNDDILTFLRKLPDNKFAEQRNALHYINNYWLYPDDLYKRVFDDSFGVDEEILSRKEWHTINDRKDFSILLNYIFLKFSIHLLEDLSTLSTSIQDELELIKETMKEGIHTRFNASFLS